MIKILATPINTAPAALAWDKPWGMYKSVAHPGVTTNGHAQKSIVIGTFKAEPNNIWINIRNGITDKAVTVDGIGIQISRPQAQRLMADLQALLNITF